MNRQLNIPLVQFRELKHNLATLNPGIISISSNLLSLFLATLSISFWNNAWHYTNPVFDEIAISVYALALIIYLVSLVTFLYFLTTSIRKRKFTVLLLINIFVIIFPFLGILRLSPD